MKIFKNGLNLFKSANGIKRLRLPLDAECSQVEDRADARHALKVVEHLAAHQAHRPGVGEKLSHLN